ncbi:MAG: 6-pyruvoyl trahydropterin synthase family protein [Bacteroidota bacterium]
MSKIRLTKQFGFEMAHALWNYSGPCRNIHGHSYRLFVTVIGEPKNEPGNPEDGMIMDFSLLKKIVNEEVVHKLDHALIVSSKANHEFMKSVEQMFEKYYILEYQPTCENIIVDISQRISKRLPDHVVLYSLRLYETDTSYAEWYAEDNA